MPVAMVQINLGVSMQFKTVILSCVNSNTWVFPFQYHKSDQVDKKCGQIFRHMFKFTCAIFLGDRGHILWCTQGDDFYVSLSVIIANI